MFPFMVVTANIQASDAEINQSFGIPTPESATTVPEVTSPQPAPFSGVGEQQNLPLSEPPAPIISTVPKDLLKGVPSRVVQALGQTSDPTTFLQRLQNLYRAEITAAEEPAQHEYVRVGDAAAAAACKGRPGAPF